MNICVVGLGYVGLPLVIELSKHFKVTGYDIDEEKVFSINNKTLKITDVSLEELDYSKVLFSTDSSIIKNADLIIVTVPTPVDSFRRPDLTAVKNATKSVGRNLKKGAIVVYESTVYPGVTEEECLPILEQESGMKVLDDFKIGYSPERINPGDKSNTLTSVIKIISAIDKESLDVIESVYNKITKTFRAKNIKVAESAKLVENIQRDLNIALMNELRIIFDKLDIDTKAVLEAAGTKWNFHKYYPGLVGGHCISVDPYYLTHKMEEFDSFFDVILAARRINDTMHKFYAEKIIQKLIKLGSKIPDSTVLILGLTFKPNVEDIRNSRVNNLIKELKTFEIKIIAHDPLLNKELVKNEFGIENEPFDEAYEKSDLVVLAVNHSKFKEIIDKIPKEKLFRID